MRNDGLICVHKVNFTWNDYLAEQQAIIQDLFWWMTWKFPAAYAGFPLQQVQFRQLGQVWTFKQRKERSDKISGFQAFS